MFIFDQQRLLMMVNGEVARQRRKTGAISDDQTARLNALSDWFLKK
jgi:hypothetical protein